MMPRCRTCGKRIKPNRRTGETHDQCYACREHESKTQVKREFLGVPQADDISAEEIEARFQIAKQRGAYDRKMSA